MRHNLTWLTKVLKVKSVLSKACTSWRHQNRVIQKSCEDIYICEYSQSSRLGYIEVLSQSAFLHQVLTCVLNDRFTSGELEKVRLHPRHNEHALRSDHSPQARGRILVYWNVSLVPLTDLHNSPMCKKAAQSNVLADFHFVQWHTWHVWTVSPTGIWEQTASSKNVLKVN